MEVVISCPTYPGAAPPKSACCACWPMMAPGFFSRASRHALIACAMSSRHALIACAMLRALCVSQVLSTQCEAAETRRILRVWRRIWLNGRQCNMFPALRNPCIMPRKLYAPHPDFRGGGRNRRLSAMQAVTDCSHSYRTHRPMLKREGAIGAQGVYCDKGQGFTSTKTRRSQWRVIGIIISCAPKHGKVRRTVLRCVCACCGPGLPRDACSHLHHMNSLVPGTRILISLALLRSFCLSLALFDLLSVFLSHSLLSDWFCQIVSFFCAESPASGAVAARHRDTSDADTARHRGAVTPRAFAKSFCHASLR